MDCSEESIDAFNTSSSPDSVQTFHDRLITYLGMHIGNGSDQGETLMQVYQVYIAPISGEVILRTTTKPSTGSLLSHGSAKPPRPYCYLLRLQYTDFRADTGDDGTTLPRLVYKHPRGTISSTIRGEAATYSR